MLSVALALAAAVSWGLSDFLGGFNSRRLPLAIVMLATQIVGLAVLMPLAVLHGPFTLEPVHVAYAVGGSLAGLVGIAALYRGMAVGSLSIVAPISATGAALPVLAGWLRGERATTPQTAGVVLALIGIVLASMVPETDTRERKRVRGLGPGVGLAILAACGFGFFFVLLHEASARDVLWAGVVQRVTGSLVMIGIACVLRRTPARAVKRGVSLFAAGTLDTGANVLFAEASVTGLVSLAAVLASLYPVVTVILAGIVLRERMTRQQTLGVACALLGVAGIASA